jgi:hypothetical protein
LNKNLWKYINIFIHHEKNRPIIFGNSLGFLVENQREHYIEHKREVEYSRTMIEDLKEDTMSFNRLIKINLVANEKIDTLISLLKGKERNSFAKKIYYMAKTIPLSDADLVLQNKTFEQLKGPGGLRLIRNMQTQNKIGAYYQSNKFIETGFFNKVPATRISLNIKML